MASFTPLDAMLPMNARWKERKSASTGIVINDAYAISGPHATLSWKKYWMPTMTGRRFSVWTVMSGQRNWFHAFRKLRMATVAVAGPASGRMMLR